LREAFGKLEEEFEETKAKVPEDLREQVCVVLDKHEDMRWDEAIQIVLDKTQLIV
jgi:hypothetical protein